MCISSQCISGCIIDSMFIYWILFVLCVAVKYASNEVYVDKGYPYLDGPFGTGWFFVTETGDKSPLHSIVFYPNQPGNYAVYFFIPGAGGYVEAELYTEYLSRVASHGFIVIGTDLIFPAATLPLSPIQAAEYAVKTNQSDKFVDQYRWMEANLQTKLDQKSPGVEIWWNYTALGSHSSGGDVARLLIESNHTFAQSSVFLEPVGITFSQPINFSVPSLMYGAELSEEHRPRTPPCVIPGFGYQRFYKLWTPTKVMIETKGYGHCDILDKAGWEVCATLKICVTGNHTDLKLYQDFMQGMTSAFLVSTMLGYNDSIAYVIDQSKVPVTYLQDEYEFK